MTLKNPYCSTELFSEMLQVLSPKWGVPAAAPPGAACADLVLVTLAGPGGPGTSLLCPVPRAPRAISVGSPASLRFALVWPGPASTASTCGVGGPVREVAPPLRRDVCAFSRRLRNLRRGWGAESAFLYLEKRRG